MVAYAFGSMLLSYALGAWTAAAIAGARAARELRAGCHHPHWREPFEVRSVPGAYKAFCARCGEQRDVNADGSPYVPPKH